MSTENNFTFLSHRVIKLSYDLNKGFKNDSEAKNIEIEPDINLTYNKDDNQVVVNLSIIFKKSNIPFFLEVVLSGLFQFNYEIGEKDLHKLAHINLAAMLFPFLRQIVADTTTKAGFAPLLLPPINFSASYERIKKENDVSK
jgi:preprotein translocase subunit SecB